MRELLRFYLFHKNGHIHRSRNVTAASIVVFMMFGYGFGTAFLFAWVLRGFVNVWPFAFGVALILGGTSISLILLPRARRVHRILEKYKDPMIYKNEIFAACDQDVSTALIYDSFGKTDLAVMKLRVAVQVDPSNKPARHLLMMISERDGIPMEVGVAP